MVRKEASRRQARARWKVRLSLLGGAALIVAVCVVIRYQWGAGAASAQVPASPQANVAPAPQTPAATARPAPASNLKVMAVVNGEQISRQALADACLKRHGKAVLEKMVNKHLILLECQRQNVVITARDVEQEVANIARKFNLPVDRYLLMLKSERGVDPVQYKNDIVWPTLALRRLGDQNLQISREEIDQALAAKYGAAVVARMISVGSKAKADAIWAKVSAAPDTFSTVAKNESQDTHSAAKYGLIPPIRRGAGFPEVEQAAFALKPGQVSQVIHAANQYLILKCEQHLPPQQLTVAQKRQAIERITQKLRDRKLNQATAQAFAALQERAKPHVVNVLNDPRRSQQLPGVAAMVYDRRITIQELAEACLARHGADVLNGEIHRKLLMQALRQKQIQVTEADINQEIARAAIAYGVVKADGTPDLDRWLVTVTERQGSSIETYLSDAVWPTVALKKLVQANVQVTEEDLQKGYAANYGPRVQARAIVMGNQRTAQRVWDLARKNPTVEFFAELARQYSVEPYSKAHGGKVPPIRRGGGSPQIESEAFRLKPGETSGIIVVGNKFVIIRSEGMTKPVEVDFAEVREELAKDIHEKKVRIAMAKYFEGLRKAAQIDNFLANTTQAGKRVARPRVTNRNPAAPTGQR